MIKHRAVVHIALNAKGERIRVLVSVGGALVSFTGDAASMIFKSIKKESAMFWLEDFLRAGSLSEWKSKSKQLGAVRFQRVMVVGG